MRVISGKARGTHLRTIEGMSTRPTTDRVKEALFSSIQFEVLDANCLDAFAGSGALGIEALSRGAELAVFIDQSPECVKVINQNLVKTSLIDKAKVIKGDVFDVVSRLKGTVSPFGLVFLDPPYGQGLCEKIILRLIQDDMLIKNAIIVIEHDNNEILEATIGPFIRVKSKRYGSTYLSTYREAD
ncbi:MULTISPECIES: 16S rRNA (guanine(966)-N(2))-methyltransferase RsmD [unclassified Fusibacter]|uniref:16S rRNA (guanine(966)-N(2))-methyltransferase RsmD n=1 Tax=unclassified Fusibacter TaxID=2624464 RepID=UPI001012DCC9|nr:MULTISPECIES: 16S rRNA (guanine(966)-N(2))-methyltransferase RsmD [unclassified Fusibacter]MCK8058066.1 16S rRNA (guanine(966)-N(2))-methyltransferase RsmD [Fusibacter sp. A2]NPE20648.1 16S rRNA (guanine(966)-N(2))-methyltransferase RsmD [Fusibacter sp. A1]RXV62854.1 16S rRNA (guanine(966)-N(2))-methyltransferase RsmD [Fusibacter sp. A1]